MPVAEGVWAGWDLSGAGARRRRRADGRTLDLRITEELWEAAFFDVAKLWVVDHPAGVEVASNLRILPGEPSDDRVLAAADVRPVVAAWDGHGRDVTSRIAARDEVYADGYERGDAQGVAARPWTFTFDLGAAPAAPVRLLLEGWIFPADASLNLAVAQRAEALDATRLGSGDRGRLAFAAPADGRSARQDQADDDRHAAAPRRSAPAAHRQLEVAALGSHRVDHRGA